MIRKILRHLLLFSFALATTNQVWHNLTFSQPNITIITVAAVLTLFEIFLKPVLRLLLLPINILSLGTLRLVINTLGLYLSVFLIPQFSVASINLNSYLWQGFTTPNMKFIGFWAFFLTTSTINIFHYIFIKIVKRS